MKSRTKVLLFTTVAAWLCAVGATPAAPASLGVYWPLNDGDQTTFVYNRTDSLTISVSDLGGGQFGVSESSDAANATLTLQTDQDSSSLVSVQEGWVTVSVDPAVLLLDNSALQNGGTLTTATTVSQQGISYPATFTTRVANAGTVTVPAGTYYDCRSISSTEVAHVPGHGTISASALTAYLAPNVGIIKTLVKPGVWAELQSGSVGGVDVSTLAGADTVAVSASPTGGGKVTGGGTFPSGTSHTVTATPSASYAFADWTENGNPVSTEASYTFTVAGNISLVANFTSSSVSSPITVAVSPPGTGTVSPNDNGQSLQVGKKYTLTAKPANGCKFIGWTGSNNSGSTTLTFTMAPGLSFTANFKDTQRPVCAVLYPKAKESITTSTITATGKASDNVGVAAVYYQLNTDPWTLAEGTTNWSTPGLTLASGANVLRAYAVDAAGNASLTNSITFTCAVGAPPTGRAPANINGQILTFKTDHVLTACFGDSTFSSFDNANASNSEVGNYTYLKTGPNAAQLNLTDTAPPPNAGSQPAVYLIFTSTTTATFALTNFHGVVQTGTMILAGARDYAPASVAGKTITNSKGGSGKFNNDGTVTSNNGVTTPYTYAPYSPTGAMFTWPYNGSGGAGTAYVQVQFTGDGTGSYWEWDIDTDGNLVETSSGTFTLK